MFLFHHLGVAGVSSFLVGQVNSQEEKCQRFLCKSKNLLFNDRYRNETQQLFQCPCTLDRMGFHWEPYQKRGLQPDIRCYIISQVAKTKLLKGNPRNKVSYDSRLFDELFESYANKDYFVVQSHNLTIIQETDSFQYKVQVI